ncbi:glycosyltransferase family 2 protein [Rhizobium lentis]|uniref:Succinoglycan biosynthesis protein ExoO n=1 Tax=Rhizobium lentis TaxID=1138194 RepID=A0A7W8UM68_9HYPH|nr:glycosyltransferase family 2 protein [Rhizobium lentis]MBB4571990.1 succinoglycan biosynthesis protein ExoO [Rhizobium lentis]MBB5548818.1 succinoglycan biosynthesis protein ExoO [Rhizobium lentis]MBB5559350.1 succinoglycan biosynthesis protein ExoO [Rhizobium lentis]MBB5565127.1 succinoglycan biosynthesis protein ExoO [Rhizobium lentis]
MYELQRIDVSVVIAAYNCAPFVDRAINSALSQEDVSLEVIVVDDCSTDNSADVIRALAKQDKRVRLVQLEKNGGPSAARNAGIAASRGTWISVLDADDAFLPNRLSRLLVLGELQNADIVADNFVYFDAVAGSTGNPALRSLPREQIIDLHAFLKQARPYAPEADFGLLKPFYRRSFLDRHAISYRTDCRHGEDFLIYTDILRYGGRFVLLREPGYLYTTRSSGLSRTVIDYKGQIQAMDRLSREPDLIADPKTQHLLIERRRALIRLSVERRCANNLLERRYASLVWSALVDRSNADIPLAMLKRIIRKKRRRSAEP